MDSKFRNSFQFEIKNFVQLPEYFSPIAYFDDCEWQLHVQCKDQNVGVFLRCLNIKPASKRVCTSFKLSVLKQDRSEGITSSNYFIYAKDFKPKKQTFEDGYGHPILIKKDVLTNPASGYIKNSTVTFQAEISTFSANFGDASLNKNFWAPLNAISPDVTFVVGGKQVKVHRQIVSQRCQFLRGLLYPNYNKEIPLDDCDYRAMLTAVRFIYTRECIVDSNKLREVLFIGKKFGLDELLLACFALLSPENAVWFVPFVEHLFPKQHKMNKKFWKYVGNHVSAILKSDAIHTLAHDELVWFTDRPEVKSNAKPTEIQAVRGGQAKKNKKKTGPSTPTTDSNLCVICQSKKVDTLIVPCNHLSLCSEDAAKLWGIESKKCPVCRGEIKSFSKVFLP